MKKSKYLLFAGLFLLSCNTQSRQSGETAAQEKAASTETTAQENVASTDSTVQENENTAETMAPPANPMALNDCPQTDSQLRVELSRKDDLQKAVIYRDGKIIQTFNDELFTDWYDQAPESFIHYVDANFDGLTDIFLGPGHSRTYSSLLIWNPKTEKFERYGSLGEPSLQNPIFAPAEKAIYTSGSNSAWEYIFTKDVWKDVRLQTVQTVTYYDNPREYESMNGTSVKKYNLYGANEKLIKATEDIKQLPSDWQAIIELTLKQQQQ